MQHHNQMVRVAGDEELSETRVFHCPFTVWQYVALDHNWPELEHKAFEELEFLLDGEKVGTDRALQFRFPVCGTVRLFSLRYDDSVEGYLLDCEGSETFFCMN